jgi:hypothetical protein
MRRVLVLALTVFVIGLVGCNKADSDPAVNKDVQNGKPGAVRDGAPEMQTKP